MKIAELSLLGIVLLVTSGARAEIQFRSVEIDSELEIGYGLAIADVDGDGRPDLILVDRAQVVWYRNPSWQKHIIVGKLTTHDHVCVAARDIDGDGRAEIAVGAEWNPSDTEASGSVHYLIPPKDRTQRWEAVRLPAEPTVHRMAWVANGDGTFDLVVVPLHGRGNRDGEGKGVRVLAYRKPKDPRDPWTTKVLEDRFHRTHNFEVLPGKREQILLGGQEGVLTVPRLEHIRAPEPWNGVGPVGEIRRGSLAGKRGFTVTIEPMHGHQVVVYTDNPEATAGAPYHPRRQVIAENLRQGHALACGDLLGQGHDVIVCGWRGTTARDRVGIQLLIPNEAGTEWRTQLVDDNTLACEDLKLGDLDGDTRLDIVACGRRTRNLKIYFNEGPRRP